MIFDTLSDILSYIPTDFLTFHNDALLVVPKGRHSHIATSFASGKEEDVRVVSNDGMTYLDDFGNIKKDKEGDVMLTALGKKREKIRSVKQCYADAGMPFEGPPIQVGDCKTTGNDISWSTSVSSFGNDDHVARVQCKAGCQNVPRESTIGTSIHPLSSTICSSAIADGILPTEGGVVFLVKSDESLPSYTGKKLATASSVPGTNLPEGSYHMYSTDNINHLASDVRIIDKFGSLSTRGRAQVRTNNGWADISGMNKKAADLVCQNLGLLHGFPRGSGACVKMGNCGSLSSPIMGKDIHCNGGDVDINACEKKEVDAGAKEHTNDTIISCSNQTCSDHPEKYTVRLMVEGDEPGMTGIGILQMYDGNEWQTISRKGWRPENAEVMCRQMGYKSYYPRDKNAGCDGVEGQDICGTQKPGFMKVACRGSEKHIGECSFTKIIGKSKETASSEDNVVVKCGGKAGDPRGLPPRAKLPQLLPAPFVKFDLTCQSTLNDTPLRDTNPGSSGIGMCPKNCTGTLEGTKIYTSKSSICAAAVHSGMLSSGGGPVMVTVGHPQDIYTGSENCKMSSVNDTTHDGNSFLVSIPTPEVLARGRYHSNSHYWAGISAQGGEFKVPKVLDKDTTVADYTKPESEVAEE